MPPTNPPATAPGLVVLFFIFAPFVGIGVWWWLGELERRRDEDRRSVEEWERFKRDASPQWPRSIP